MVKASLFWSPPRIAGSIRSCSGRDHPPRPNGPVHDQSNSVTSANGVLAAPATATLLRIAPQPVTCRSTLTPVWSVKVCSTSLGTFAHGGSRTVIVCPEIDGAPPPDVPLGVVLSVEVQA